jgi:hypothetical protein
MNKDTFYLGNFEVCYVFGYDSRAFCNLIVVYVILILEDYVG